MTYPFLSEPWIQALEAIRDEAPAPPAGAEAAVVNLIVVGGPDGDVHAHAQGGQLDRGLIDDAPTTVTVPYDVAKKLLVDADPSAALKAVMSGELTIQGNPANLLAMQAQLTVPTPEMMEFHRKVRAFTE